MTKTEIIIQIGKDDQISITDDTASVDENLNQLSTNTGNTFKSTSWGDTWCYIRKIVTVKPLLMFYMLGLNLVRPAFENLMLQTGCLVDS